MKWIFLLNLCFSSLSLAQDLPGIAMTSVVHGQATVTFDLPPGFDWAAVILMKNHVVVDPEAPLLVPASRVLSRQVYFRYGAGDYTINIGGHRPGEPSGHYVVTQIQNVTAAYLPDPYLSPSNAIESDDPLVQNLSQKIISDARVRTDREKALAIHDWVTHHISYDVEALGHLNENPDWIDPQGPTSALSTLKTKKGLCQEYAYITVALLRAAGIRAAFVSGDASYDGLHWMVDRHAWVHAFFDNRWIEIDTTWDAGVMGSAGGSKVELFHFAPGEKFFDPSPADFAQSHRSDQEHMMY